MQCKAVCPSCGEIVKTYSIKNFRHCGAQFDVEANLLAGEGSKYAKMVAKEEGGKPAEKKPVVEKPEAQVKVEGKIEEVQKPTTPAVVAPIIEEKPEPKAQPVRKPRKPQARVERKVDSSTLEPSFGFF